MRCMQLHRLSADVIKGMQPCTAMQIAQQVTTSLHMPSCTTSLQATPGARSLSADCLRVTLGHSWFPLRFGCNRSKNCAERQMARSWFPMKPSRPTKRQWHVCTWGWVHNPPPPFSDLRKSTELIRSLRVLQLRQGRSLCATHTTTSTNATAKKGEDNARISPKSELCGFNWANNHNKCVHDSM